MKKKISFLRFVLHSMDDDIKSHKNSSFFVPAIIAIVVWILFASTGLQEAFKSITDLQQMIDVWENGNQALNQYLESANQANNTSWWSNVTSVFSEEKPQNSMSPFTRSFIVNLCAIFTLILFLAIMCRHEKSNWQVATISTGVATVPLTIGMFIGYIFIKMATKSQSENLPSIFYSLGAIAVMTSFMTAFIMLYINIHSVLGIKNRKRYYTIIFSVFIVLGVTSGLTHYLS